MALQPTIGFTRPKVPVEYDPNFFAVQLGNIERALVRRKPRLVTADTTMTQTDDGCVLYCDPAGGTITYTLLPADQARFIEVTLAQISAGTVTLAGTISGAASPTLGGQWKCMTIGSNGSVYVKLASV